jgi:hypothetical protein
MDVTAARDLVAGQLADVLGADARQLSASI